MQILVVNRDLHFVLDFSPIWDCPKFTFEDLAEFIFNNVFMNTRTRVSYIRERAGAAIELYLVVDNLKII